MNKLVEYIDREALKMRDVAVVPTLSIVSLFPKILIGIVAAITIFAAIKLINIAKKNAKNQVTGAPEEDKEKSDEEQKDI